MWPLRQRRAESHLLRHPSLSSCQQLRQCFSELVHSFSSLARPSDENESAEKHFARLRLPLFLIVRVAIGGEFDRSICKSDTCKRAHTQPFSMAVLDTEAADAFGAISRHRCRRPHDRLADAMQCPPTMLRRSPSSLIHRRR